jgi:hypothetical protein
VRCIHALETCTGAPDPKPRGSPRPIGRSEERSCVRLRPPCSTACRSARTLWPYRVFTWYRCCATPHRDPWTVSCDAAPAVLAAGRAGGRARASEQRGACRTVSKGKVFASRRSKCRLGLCAERGVLVCLQSPHSHVLAEPG